MSKESNMEKDDYRLHHIGVFTVHPKRMLNFYLGKLGFKEKNRGILSKAQAYALFRAPYDCVMAKLTKANVCVEIFWSKGKMSNAPRPSVIGYNHFGIEMGARDAFCRRIKNRKRIRIIKIKRGDHYTCFIRDPDGNLIELRQAPHNG